MKLHTTEAKGELQNSLREALTMRNAHHSQYDLTSAIENRQEAHGTSIMIYDDGIRALLLSLMTERSFKTRKNNERKKFKTTGEIS